jgi:hypothetical protein
MLLWRHTAIQAAGANLRNGSKADIVVLGLNWSPAAEQFFDLGVAELHPCWTPVIALA